ncbi:hypothetical protein RclHR1_06140006 [Rhizophagus clarus]|uniref:Arrestin C-terminal-like domain-containing protein n=1 Tax=Rhizophagus clarus TaxID=94130 RepID=A0A2Z6RRH7_9GLOM|nr:hypothetical protein RclHR1_06140006 [Rhizophagus clarus]
MIPSRPTRLFESNAQDKLSYDYSIEDSNLNDTSLNDIIQINLFDPVVIFRGNANESAGSLLRGEIVLTLNKPMKINFIECKFSGKVKIIRPNGAFGTIDNYKERIISQDIILLSHSTSPNTTITPSSSSSSLPINLFSKPLFSSSRTKKIYYTFSSGIHRLSFEINLPGSLPASVKTDSGGVELSRSYDKIIDYQLSIPKKSYSLDEIIPINIKIIPLIKQFQLYSVGCSLLQKITFMKDDDNTSETVKSSNYNNIFRFNENHDKIYETTLNFELPKCNDIIIHHSVNTPLIRVKHELRFCLLISIMNNDYGIKSKLYFNVGINLLSRLVKNDDVYLPNYDDVSFYCPCHPEYKRIAESILGDSYNSGESCNDLTCKFCNLTNNKPPQYSRNRQ